MGSKVERVRTKQIQEKCQRLLNDMLKEDDNKYCVDCDAKGPRWASWNIGIFLCIRCAGIHRKLGVHISKVKSVNLDLWTPQQVVSLQQMGNSGARAVYEAHLPDNFRRPQSEGNLESFIRAKYEHKKFIAPEWVAPTLPKVNWDEEFQEEAEKLKKKKREVIQSNFLSIRPQSTTQVTPQPLAKPQYSSPKPLQMSSQATNLLELDTSKETVSKKLSSDFDLFTSFQSAPMDNSPNNASAQVLNGSNANSALKTEEEDSFFNQALSSTSNNQKPLTKDTILALYGNLENYVSPQLNKFHLSSLNGCNSAFTSPNIAQSTQQQFPNIAVTSTSNMALVSNPFYSMAASGGQSNFPLEKAFSIAPMSNGTGGSDVSQAQFAQRMEAMNLNKTNQLSFPPSSLFDANAEAKNQLQQNFEQFVPTTSLWE